MQIKTKTNAYSVWTKLLIVTLLWIFTLQSYDSLGHTTFLELRFALNYQNYNSCKTFIVLVHKHSSRKLSGGSGPWDVGSCS